MMNLDVVMYRATTAEPVRASSAPLPVLLPPYYTSHDHESKQARAEREKEKTEEEHQERSRQTTCLALYSQYIARHPQRLRVFWRVLTPPLHLGK